MDAHFAWPIKYCFLHPWSVTKMAEPNKICQTLSWQWYDSRNVASQEEVFQIANIHTKCTHLYLSPSCIPH